MQGEAWERQGRAVKDLLRAEQMRRRHVEDRLSYVHEL